MLQWRRLFFFVLAVAVVETQAQSTWSERIEVSGDVRFRHEYVNKTKPLDTSAYHKERLRLRFGAMAKINDEVRARFRLTTADGQNPLGPNATLTDNASKKGIYVDIGEIDWTPYQGGMFMLGKMENPLRILPQSQVMFDVDYTPEGLAYAHQSGALFAKAAAYVIQERAQQGDGTSEPDSWLFSGLLGYKNESPEGLGLMGAIGYHDFTSLRKNAALPLGTSGGNFLGNSSVGTRYRHDYQVGEAIGEVRLSRPGHVWIVYADFLNNFYVDKANRALLAGFTFQTLNEQRKPVWSAGYGYQTVNKDATVSAINYSDFGNGIDGAFGHIFTLARTLGPNTSLTLTFTHANVDNVGNPYWADRGTADLLATF